MTAGHLSSSFRSRATLGSSVLTLIIFWISKDLPFFWDTIQLGARQATHFYEGGSWLLPDAIDSGHPPAFGAYLALWWKVLGRSLRVSHLAMLPWVWLLLQQLFYFARELAGSHWWALALLPLLDAVLLGQLLLVSPDVVLMAAFVWGGRQAWRGREGNRWVLCLAALVLSMISTRGWIAGFALYLLTWVPDYLRSRYPAADLERPGQPGLSTAARFALKALMPFLAAGLLALGYLYAHYQAKGWVGYHPDSPWAGSFRAVGFGGMVRNFGLIGWRWLDVGRLLLWIVLPVAIYLRGWRRLRKEYNWWWLLAAAAFFQLLLLPLILAHLGLTGPRYLLPAIFFFDLWVAYTIVRPVKTEQFAWKRWQKTGFATVALALLLGNLLIYPQRIAQAWDATPAHYPFYEQEAQAINFLDENGLALERVGTVFPSVGPRDWRELNHRTTGFKAADLSTDAYLFVSMVHNDWSDADLDFIEARYSVIWQQSSRNGVWSAVMKRN